MTLKELQNTVDTWILGHGGYWSEFEILARMTEELGEISSDLQRMRGLRGKVEAANLEGEIGDLLFTLAALANCTNVDLKHAMSLTLKKYSGRKKLAEKNITILQTSREQSSAWWSALDLLNTICDSHATKDWKVEKKERTLKKPLPLPTDKEVMRLFAVAIAYSQGARSSLIQKLIQTIEFSEAFGHYDLQVLAHAAPEAILKKHWHLLSAMRFRKKVKSIVHCAFVLNEISGKHGSFSSYLNTFSIPRRLHSFEDIDLFWQGFDRLKADFKTRKMPFFKSTTSLLQLLLDLDYDAVKPDLIVMRLARRIGLAARETGDKAFRSTVRKLQEYAVARKKRVRFVDLQMLAFGGQSNASKMLKTLFCLPKDPCHHSACPLAHKGLCISHSSLIQN